ncbi:MAG: DNA mismatch repair endonuclease MutL [Pyrinomonadaceae bacterium]|nr:DNA mismatch repair endonuclease MutL [Pyrinomonadaceae bacterium]MBP6212593.1 DNA mismatch repair endonuclease MutL [Pyrinomonadaceae bacterium]
MSFPVISKIKILPDTLANQIAAGEVVERPASVIKELVENSIDAGARRLTVEIELGGRRLMRVVDDGEGMSRDDAVLAFERHATSKIRTLEDLGAIATLGFRGEALASIASVAKVGLTTKQEVGIEATRVVVEGGRLLDVKDAARDTGTTIEVRDLFFNTPARRKFMRSEATENYHLTTIVTHYALAHPEIAFELRNNGREVLRVSPAKDLKERAFQIFGAGLLDSLLPVSGGREYVARVSGFISAPRERRTTRDSQYFFVNQRFVRDKTITGGLLEGYRSVLPHGVYPVAFLFIDIPHEEVDVNVHPAKTEVRFRRGEAVKDVIAEAVREALASAGIVPDNEGTILRASEISEEMGPVRVPDLIHEQPRIEFSGSQLPDLVTPEHEPYFNEPNNSAEVVSSTEYLSVDSEPDLPTESNFDAADSREFEESASTSAADGATPPRGYAELPPVNSAERLVRSIDSGDVSSAKIQPIGQLHNSFIIAVDDEGLLLIDQHVAHERILFDKFRKSETERGIESQNLLLPETIDLSPAQSEAFRLIEGDLESLGFGLMRLSGRTVAIKSVPTDLAASEARNLFAEILDTVDAEKRGSPKSTLRDDIAASLACKAAVKINMKLTTEKMQWLIDRLLITTSPTTCPHGRPVILRFSMKDIERGFHRT